MTNVSAAALASAIVAALYVHRACIASDAGGFFKSQLPGGSRGDSSQLPNQ